MFLPEEAGGDGEGAVTMFLVMEALGRCGGSNGSAVLPLGRALLQEGQGALLGVLGALHVLPRHVAAHPHPVLHGGMWGHVADHARFGLTEVKVGLLATSGGLVRLPKLIPAKIASEIPSSTEVCGAMWRICLASRMGMGALAAIRWASSMALSITAKIIDYYGGTRVWISDRQKSRN